MVADITEPQQHIIKSMQFKKHHESKVAAPQTSQDEVKAGIDNNYNKSLLERVLDKHSLSLDDFFPKIQHERGQTIFSSSDIAQAISSFKNDSTTGPSGQGKQFFKFLFRFDKTFFTNAINQLLYLPDLETTSFAWIKKRKVIFIKKKKDTIANQCSDYRPISLLQQLYKLLAKLTLSKVLPHMTSLISCNQFGFCPGRAMSLANLSTLHLIEELKSE